jgi:hypothetical protein
MPHIAIYKNKSMEQLFKRFQEICKREGRSQSKVITELILCYVKEHEKGNPQKPLLPTYEKPLYVVSNFPMERRGQNVEWLLSLINRYPGQTIQFWMARFSRLGNVRMETVKEYLQMLRLAKEIRYVGDKVYARGMQPGVEEAKP